MTEYNRREQARIEKLQVEVERLQRAYDSRGGEMDSMRMVLAETQKWNKDRLADNERLRALVKELADDLECELKGHYNGTLDYPSERRRFERDMDSVYRARRALEHKP